MHIYKNACIKIICIFMHDVMFLVIITERYCNIINNQKNSISSGTIT